MMFERPKSLEERSWAQHAYTRKCHQAFERMTRDLHLSLLRSCQGSTDPQVVGAYWRYADMVQFMEFLTPEAMGDDDAADE